nr:uncharacterized protein LOC118060569 [Populus alba]
MRKGKKYVNSPKNIYEVVGSNSWSAFVACHDQSLEVTCFSAKKLPSVHRSPQSCNNTNNLLKDSKDLIFSTNKLDPGCGRHLSFIDCLMKCLVMEFFQIFIPLTSFYMLMERQTIHLVHLNAMKEAGELEKAQEMFEDMIVNG